MSNARFKKKIIRKLVRIERGPGGLGQKGENMTISNNGEKERYESTLVFLPPLPRGRRG